MADLNPILNIIKMLFLELTAKSRTPNCLYFRSSFTKSLAARAPKMTPINDIALGETKAATLV